MVNSIVNALKMFGLSLGQKETKTATNGVSNHIIDAEGAVRNKMSLNELNNNTVKNKYYCDPDQCSMQPGLHFDLM